MWRVNRRVDAAVPTGRAPQPAGPDLTAALAGAQRGDPDAFRVLYRDTQPRVLRYLHALVGGDAEDVASETWLQVARDLAGFTGDADGFRGWVATIARHRAIDHQRYQGRRPATPVPAEDLAYLAAGDDTSALALDAVATDAAIGLIARRTGDRGRLYPPRRMLVSDQPWGPPRRRKR